MEEFKYHPHPRPYYAWIIWFLCVVFIFFNYLIEFATLSIPLPFRTHPVGNIVSTTTLLDPYAISVILLQSPVAMIIDKIGPRKMTSLAIAIFGLGALFFSYSTSAIEIWIAVFILGVGATVSVVNVMKLVSNWFLPHRFATIAGLSITMVALGAYLGQKLTFFLIESVGWRMMMTNFGIAAIVYALIFFSVVRDNSPGARYSIYPKALVIPFREAASKVFKNPQNYFIAIFFGLVMSPLLTYVGIWHVPFFKATFNASESLAKFVNDMNLLAFGIGAPFFGWLSTKCKSRKLFLYIGVLVCLIVNLCIIYIPSISFTFVAILTTVSGFFFSVSILAFPIAFEKNNPTTAATVLGMLVVSVAVLRLIVNRLVVFLFTSNVNASELQSSQKHVISSTIFPTLLILALITLFFIKETHAEQAYD